MCFLSQCDVQWPIVTFQQILTPALLGVQLHIWVNLEKYTGGLRTSRKNSCECVWYSSANWIIWVPSSQHACKDERFFNNHFNLSRFVFHSGIFYFFKWKVTWRLEIGDQDSRSLQFFPFTVQNLSVRCSHALFLALLPVLFVSFSWNSQDQCHEDFLLPFLLEMAIGVNENTEEFELFYTLMGTVKLWNH
jgi:hypothetical protein